MYLLWVMDNDFGPSIMNGDETVDFHLPSSQELQVAKLAPVRSKDHACEGAGAVIHTEVEKGVAGARGKDAQDSPGDAAAFARVGARILEVHTANSPRAHGGPRSETRAHTPPPVAIAHQRPHYEHGDHNSRDQGDYSLSRQFEPSQAQHLPGRYGHGAPCPYGNNPRLGLPARTKAVYQSEPTNEASAANRFQANKWASAVPT